MYIITFYSFKGGVGRTMAMTNVGLSLAKTGRKVLLVDFDLEAPGLDTFDLLKPAVPTHGLVDFVTEYRATRAAPDVSKFVYRPPNPSLDGELWVMPTGKQDGEYGTRLNRINWSELYSEQDGFLLFEDLKEQWLRVISPDYVLIDSRTGHTDVGGICTRQLPDAVALLFFPNEQNRRGLEAVVRDINRESQDSSRPIEKYFIAANVPNLDDEHSILSSEIRKFAPMMQQPRPDATIHHYDSLSLLQQQIFTIDHPTTRLAREYEQLASVVTSSNLGDKAIVVEYLDRLSQGRRSRSTKLNRVDERLKEIGRRYAEDGEVLYTLGNANRSLGRSEEAGALFASAARLGFLSEEKMGEEAVRNYSVNARESARELVARVLNLTVRRVFPLTRLLSEVVRHDIDFLPEVLRKLNAKNLEAEDRFYVASHLEVDRRALPAIADFLRPLADTPNEMQLAARSEVALCMIGLSRFEEAKTFLLSRGATVSEFDIRDAFNYAMALWGIARSPQRDLFLQVVNLDQKLPMPGANANYFQCLSIANWAIGRKDVARNLAAKSKAALNEDGEFSAWRYLRVPLQDFIQDLESLNIMIETGEGQPAVFL